MTREMKNDGFIRFCKNRKFIEWKLLPTNESESYWKNYLKEHPHEEEVFRRANEYFNNVNFSSKKISPKDKESAIRLLEREISRYSRKQKSRKLSIIYGSIAAIGLILLTLPLFTPRHEETEIPTEQIVGNLLQSQDIQLITSAQRSSFEKDIKVEVEADGTLHVKEKDATNKQIPPQKDSPNRLIVPYGKRSTLTLADGSEIWLNSGSVLEFPNKFEKGSREVTLLSGEAYLDVAHDPQAPFHLNTPTISVQVLGTQFNISSYNHENTAIVLVSGSVSLKDKVHDKEIMIKPSEQAISSADGTFTVKHVDVDRYTSWKDGYLLFDNTPIDQVLKQIGRYYNLSFNLESGLSLQKKKCSGKIILSEKLDNVMTAITLISDTAYKIEDKTITIIDNP